MLKLNDVRMCKCADFRFINVRMCDEIRQTSAHLHIYNLHIYNPHI